MQSGIMELRRPDIQKFRECRGWKPLYGGELGRWRDTALEHQRGDDLDDRDVRGGRWKSGGQEPMEACVYPKSMKDC